MTPRSVRFIGPLGSKIADVHIDLKYVETLLVFRKESLIFENDRTITNITVGRIFVDVIHCDVQLFKDAATVQYNTIQCA